MKGFYIEVNNNLLEQKHLFAMGAAVWLFMWCLDKTTQIDTERGIGKVLGGKPITYQEIRADLGISESTYNRWTAILRTNGYITTVRTPAGLQITVNKAQKPRLKKGTVKNDGSVDNSLREPSNVTDRTVKIEGGTVRSDGSNIRHNNDYNRDNKKKGFSKPVDKPNTNVAGNTSWKPEYDGMGKPNTDSAEYRKFELHGEYIKSGSSLSFEEWYAKRKQATAKQKGAATV